MHFVFLAPVDIYGKQILGGIRMLKFMAWERSFERRVLSIREKELKYQKKNYYIAILFNAVWWVKVSRLWADEPILIRFIM
jgi:hypothetical protein